MKTKKCNDREVSIDIEFDSAGLLIFLAVIQLVMLIGKLAGTFNIGWGVVFLPTLGLIGFFLLVFIFAVMIDLSEELTDDCEE